MGIESMPEVPREDIDRVQEELEARKAALPKMEAEAEEVARERAEGMKSEMADQVFTRTTNEGIREQMDDEGRTFEYAEFIKDPAILAESIQRIEGIIEAMKGVNQEKATELNKKYDQLRQGVAAAVQGLKDFETKELGVR